jgi:hypothetical protein
MLLLKHWSWLDAWMLLWSCAEASRHRPPYHHHRHQAEQPQTSFDAPEWRMQL